MNAPDDGVFKNSDMRHVNQVSLQHRRGGSIELWGGAVKYPPPSPRLLQSGASMDLHFINILL